MEWVKKEKREDRKGEYLREMKIERRIEIDKRKIRKKRREMEHSDR